MKAAHSLLSYVEETLTISASSWIMSRPPLPRGIMLYGAYAAPGNVYEPLTPQCNIIAKHAHVKLDLIPYSIPRPLPGSKNTDNA